MDTRPRLGIADLLTVGEVAADLRVSTSTVHRLIRAGSLRAHAMGATYRITRDDLDVYLRSASTGGPSVEVAAGTTTDQDPT